MEQMNLKQMLYADSVKRWHLVDTSRNQTVAEHSFNVCLISQRILQILGMNQESWIFGKTMVYALHHDIPEVIIGDIPTPTKHLLNIDDLDLATILDPDSVTDVILVKEIVKMADLMDCIFFLKRYGVGDKAKRICDGIIDTVKRLLSSSFGDNKRVVDFVIDFIGE